MGYSPAVVDRWLREFELLQSLSENASTSAHLLSPQCRHSEVGCSNGRPVGIKSVRNQSDPMAYVDILGDIQGAAGALPPYSRESQVVSRLLSGHLGNGALLEGALSDRIHQIRGELATRYNDVWGAYHSACRLMALSLGWDGTEKPERTDIAAGTKTC